MPSALSFLGIKPAGTWLLDKRETVTFYGMVGFGCYDLVFLVIND